MKIGDRVELRDTRGTYYGTIVSEVVPKCRCKGLAKWVIEFDGVEGFRKISKDNGNLYPIEDNKLLVREGSIKFEF